MIDVLVLLAAQSASQDCDFAAIKSARAVHDRLGQRAVEVVSIATRTGSMADARLRQLVDQSAEFSLGGGDVGRPLGTGVLGARSLAIAMKANHYQFLGWDFMDGPADGCSKQTISVNFVSDKNRSISEVKVSFDQGRVVAAKGWQRSFTSGSLPASQGN